MSNTSGKPYRRRFSNYLLNKSLQLRYIGFVTVLSAVLSTVLGYMIWQQESKASSEVLAGVAELYCGNVPPEQCEDLQIVERMQGDLAARDTNRIKTMALIGLAMVAALIFYLLIMTHKVAGPLYKVSLYFDRMAEGKLGETYPLRKGDMLQDFYDKFRDMHVQVRERLQNDNQLLGRFLDACEAAGVEREGELETALKQMEEHKQNRDKALA